MDLLKLKAWVLAVWTFTYLNIQERSLSLFEQHILQITEVERQESIHLNLKTHTNSVKKIQSGVFKDIMFLPDCFHII